MTKRTYDQSCGLATALDLLGERWTLLILRNLMLGPQRYTDLLEGLPGIGSNLLADRLRELERLGVVQKQRLLPPAASTVYALTDEGRELEPAMAALGRWGARYMELPESFEEMPTRLGMGGLAMSFTPDSARVLDGRSYELMAGGTQFALWFADGRAHARQQQPARPAATLHIEMGTLLAIGAGEMTISDAGKAGLLRIDGDRVAAAELFTQLDLSMVGSALREEEPAAASA